MNAVCTRHAKTMERVSIMKDLTRAAVRGGGVERTAKRVLITICNVSSNASDLQNTTHIMKQLSII